MCPEILGGKMMMFVELDTQFNCLDLLLVIFCFFTKVNHMHKYELGGGFWSIFLCFFFLFSCFVVVRSRGSHFFVGFYLV